MDLSFSVITATRDDEAITGLKGAFLRNCMIDLNGDHTAQLVQCDNFANIGRAYNNGMDVARYGLCVFAHDDLEIWAGPDLLRQALEKASEEDTGFVGLAGSRLLGKSAVWWEAQNRNAGAVAHTDGTRTYMTTYGPYGRVLVVDGVLLIARKEVFALIGSWPEDLEWHFYDIEMCLKAHEAGLKNYVVPLPAFHRSVGKIKPEWHQARTKFQERWFSKLPMSIELDDA